MLTSLRRWLSSSVIEHNGHDRPFRLRRASLLLLAGGWVTFLMSCLIGLWLVKHNVPVVGWFDLVRGNVDLSGGIQAIKVACEAVGGGMFFAGMFSVSLFDKRDRIPLWKAE